MKASYRFALLTVTALVLLLFLLAGEASATLYCGRSYSELKRNPGRPYNAVGFLNNGCTATLIDAHHILAAAHCFTNMDTGAWQPGLRFYPNFHPDRVTANEAHVPRAEVLRVVVGSRSAFHVLGNRMDWGIARLGPWRDAAGLDLTPLPLATSVPAVGTALVNPAYTRHHFPYDDNDNITWDNMSWDKTYCGWVPPNSGQWVINMHLAPLYDGVTRDTTACNSRWAAGMIHANCSLAKVDNALLFHNCDTIGGSSGSPLIYKTPAGQWRIIGVGSGGGTPDTASSNEFNQLTPSCTPDTSTTSDNVGPSMERFLYAPRFASNVAVHRSVNNSSGTAVFGVDSDLNRVVYRERVGNPPAYNTQFTYWTNLGRPSTPTLTIPKLSRIAACSADSSNHPQVFVVADNKRIYTRRVNAFGQWSTWSSFGMPYNVITVADLDAATDDKGRCVLLMVAKNGSAFVRFKTSDTTWGKWSLVAKGSYKVISALRYNDTLYAAMLDASGEVWQTFLNNYLGFGYWMTPVKVYRPPVIAAWRDIDFTWDEYGRGFLAAIPDSWLGVQPDSTNTLYFLPLYGESPRFWYPMENHLWAPSPDPANPIPPQNPPNLLTLTASRWMEDAPGTNSSVIFGTDDSGNVYFIENSPLAGGTWNLHWTSFYHEFATLIR